MKIYTKTGDKGETSLLGGTRVPKDHPRIEAYGTVDELNAVLGVCRSMKPPRELDPILEELQHSLFALGAELAAPSRTGDQKSAISPDAVAGLERRIDEISSQLTPLTRFILPGGDPLAAMLHFARTVCRRAERLTVHLSHREEVSPDATVYLNRLSDLLFVLARRANALAGTEEIPWDARK